MKLKNVLEISYEELTENPEKILRNVTNFLNLHPLEESNYERNFEIFELNEKIENQNPKRLREMTTEQKEIISSKANEMLKYYGYEH